MSERQVTQAAHGHILTNIGCWSRDGEWIVYDTRSDAAGSRCDGLWIERVHVDSGRVERLFESQRGANCGVVTCCPVSDRIVFILGPERPTAEWQYAATHRRGVVLDLGLAQSPRQIQALDAMCYCEPFVPGALRGGSHVHTFDGRGRCVAFTYEDHVLQTAARSTLPPVELNLRNIGVSFPGRPVEVHGLHPRNHSGSHFSVLLSQTWDAPEPGSDQIDRAYEDAWIGSDGSGIAFLGDIVGRSGNRMTELFALDLPPDATEAGEAGPLEGTLARRPRPPLGTRQRRLTYTEEYPLPGVAGPRHWPRSSPDGRAIYFLMRSPDGASQLWSIAPSGGEPKQLTRLEGRGVTSAFSVSIDGQWIAHTADGAVCVTSTETGRTRRLTQPGDLERGPRAEACVFSPDARRIAYVRPVAMGPQVWNQVFVVECP